MKLSKAAVFVTISALILLASSSTVFAITGNYAPDSTPYVCVVVVFADAARTQPISISTGILVSPTVVLTAGHSTIGGVTASICFDQGPIDFSIENGQIVYSGSSPIYNGITVTYPEYAASVAAGAKDSQVLEASDLGVILLDQPVQGITSFAILPQVSLVDTLPVKTNLQVIGYGVQFQVTPKNNGVQSSWVGTLSRNTAQVQLLSTNFQGSDKYIKCTANAAQDKGGVAYGDSGGPVLYSANSQNIVLAINAYVDNTNCAGVTYHTRIDAPQVLSWINGYL